MPVTFPIGLSRPAAAERPQHDWAILISEGRSYRALHAAIVVAAHLDGDVWVSAPAPADIDGLLAYAVDPQGRSELATVIVGPAEVNDAYLRYGSLDVGAVNERLSELGITVRASVLPPGAA
jgi:hypothetical protein